MLCYAVPSYAMLCYEMLCYVLLFYAIRAFGGQWCTQRDRAGTCYVEIAVDFFPAHMLLTNVHYLNSVMIRAMQSYSLMLDARSPTESLFTLTVCRLSNTTIDVMFDANSPTESLLLKHRFYNTVWQWAHVLQKPSENVLPCCGCQRILFRSG